MSGGKKQCKAVLLIQCTAGGAEHICNSPAESLTYSELFPKLQRAGIRIVSVGCPGLCCSRLQLPCDCVYCERGNPWLKLEAAAREPEAESVDEDVNKILGGLTEVLKYYRDEGYEFVAVLNSNLHSSCLLRLGHDLSELPSGAALAARLIAGALEAEGFSIPVVGDRSILETAGQFDALLSGT